MSIIITPENLLVVASSLDALISGNGTQLVTLQRGLVRSIANTLRDTAHAMNGERLCVSATFERCAQIVRDAEDVQDALKLIEQARKQTLQKFDMEQSPFTCGAVSRSGGTGKPERIP